MNKSQIKNLVLRITVFLILAGVVMSVKTGDIQTSIIGVVSVALLFTCSLIPVLIIMSFIARGRKRAEQKVQEA